MSAVAPSLTVVQKGPLTTIQDAGRLGQVALGIGRSGACDRGAYELANRLVGNDEGAAVLEVTFGGLVLSADADITLVTTGARCAGMPHNAPLTLAAGDQFALGLPVTGLRTYVAVRGGIDCSAGAGLTTTRAPSSGPSRPNRSSTPSHGFYNELLAQDTSATPVKWIGQRLFTLDG